MWLIRIALMSLLTAAVLAFGACTGSDYQGGGRRSDLGTNDGNAISLAAGGDASTAGGGGTSGGAGVAGYAGCAVIGDAGAGLAIGCVP